MGIGSGIRAMIVCPTTDEKIGRATAEHLRDMTEIPVWTYCPVDEYRDGFTRTVNEGLYPVIIGLPLVHDVSYVVIANHDIRVKTHKWLERLIEALESDPSYGMASPTGKCRTQPICYGKEGMEPRIQVVSQLPMFCTVIKREVIDRLGRLDEEFIHYGSDSDYCERAKRAGYKLIWVHDVFVENKLSQLIEDWKEHDQGLFRERYGWP